MKSFGSVLNTPGSALGNKFMNQSTGLWKAKKRGWFSKVTNNVSRMIGGKVADTLRKSTSSSNGMTKTEGLYDRERDIDEVYTRRQIYDISSASNVSASNTMGSASDILRHNKNNVYLPYTEDTTKWDRYVTDQMNWYNFAAGAALNSFDVFEGDEGDEGKWKRQADIEPVVHSLFNPYMGIVPNAMLPGQYIVAQKEFKEPSSVFNNLGDCRISTLVNMSRFKSTLLGHSRYKYADFMFCKELGMPNNHLITLRRYASPVGDMIHGSSAIDPKYYSVYSTPNGVGTLDKSKLEDKRNGNDKKTKELLKNVKSTRMYNNAAQLSDIGHMCCYFGGEDNKLEDILKYSFKSTFKEMNSEIQRQSSNPKEDGRQSPLGMIINSTSRGYNAHMLKGDAGTNNLVKWTANKIGGNIGKLFGAQPWYHNEEALYHVDKNKIYEPKNTIQQMDYYEGKLQFTHEFTLVFSYKLRAYDNISPKAAMLDLIGNILQTTYNKGRFWGGARQINGPQPNPAAWNKANSIIDNTWDKLGSGIMTFLNGGVDLQSMLGSLSSFVSGLVGAAKQKAGEIISQGNGTVGGVAGVVGGKLASFFKEWNSKLGISDMLKGSLKDTLGRPQLYAWDSLLTGDDTGMWHLTVGNPLQPIITIGNLEVTNTEIQHLGPLGIDDFPTELKVTVSLKHARPRDLVSIEKMYMMGSKRIYHPHVRRNPSKIYSIFEPTEITAYQDEQAKEDAADMAATNMKKSAPSSNTQTSHTSGAIKSKDNNKQKDGSTTPKPQTEEEKAAQEEASRKAAAAAAKKQHEEATKALDDIGFTADLSKVAAKNELSDNSEYTGYENNLEYINEFDFRRMKANMDELV